MNPLRSRSFFLLLLSLCISSCSFFGVDTSPPVPVVSCSYSSSPAILDTLDRQMGTVSLIDVEINGVPEKRWVILPDGSSSIYYPCNLPNEVKIKWERIYFSALVVDRIAIGQDSSLGGLQPIELTQLEK